MRLHPPAFNRLLAHFAQHFDWRRSSACPCLKPGTLQPDRNCKHCEGRGRIWEAPVVVPAAVAGKNAQQKWMESDLWEQGDMVLSIPEDSPLYELGLFDRLTSREMTEPFSQNFVRSVNERMRFRATVIDRASWINPAGGLVRPDPPVMDDQGLPIWPAENAPPPGVTYSLTGRKNAEFFVYIELPNDRPMHAGARLPRKVVMRKFDLFGR